jgi:hypothetical protein
VSPVIWGGSSTNGDPTDDKKASLHTACVQISMGVTSFIALEKRQARKPTQKSSLLFAISDNEHGIGNIVIPRLDRRNMSRRLAGYKMGHSFPISTSRYGRLDSNPTRYSA